MLIEAKIDDRELLRTLDKLSRKVRDLAPVMREISGDMLDSVHENFAREGRPNPWKKSRRAAETGGHTLQDTNRLYRSITARSDANSAMVGTNVKYAAIHHFGGTIKKKESQKVIHFKRGTVDQFANQDDANRQLHMPNGRTLYFKRGAGAGFHRANMKASYAMKVTIGAHEITMPARPFLVLADADTRKIVERIKKYLGDV